MAMNVRTRARLALIASLLGATTLWTGPAAADAATSQALYGKAFTLFQAGNVRAARIELQNALKENPRNGAARILSARVNLVRGDGVAAQTDLEKAIDAGAQRDRVRHLMANAYLLQREYNKALDEADPRRVPQPFAGYAARMRGRAQSALSNPSGAGPEFERAVTLSPRSAEAWTDLARHRASQKNVPGGVAAVDRALAIAPTNAQALLFKGDLTRATSGLAAALPYFNRVIAQDANNIEALLERAATLGDLRREKEARADIAKVKGLIPDHPLALYLEAMLEARNGRFQSAQTLLGRTKGMLDRYPPAQLLTGLIAYQLGNFVQANEAFGRAAGLLPGNPVALKLLATTQLRRGDARAALATLSPLASRPDLDAGSLALLGSASARAGDFPAAQRYLERAAALAPNQRQVGTQLALTRLAQGDLSGAEGQLQSVLRADPNSLQALVSLAAVNLRERDFRAAGSAAQRVVKAYPQLPIGYNLRGAAALGLRDLKLAEINFRQAIGRKPDYVEARRNLAQLLLLTNRADQARQQVDVMLKANPRDANAMLLAADIAGARRLPAERLDWLRRASAAAPNALGPRVALVQTYLQARQPNRALTEATAVARARPDDPRALQLLGGAQVAARQLPAARATFERLVQQRPTDVGSRMMLARVETVAGDLAAARATYDAALKLPGARPEPVLIDLIGLDLRARDYNAALARAEAIKRVTPNKAAADKLIGDINLRAGRNQPAIAAYQRARATANNAEINTAIASAQFRSGQAPAALATLTTYARANPRDPLGAVAVADFHTQTKNWRAAAAAYEAMRRAGPRLANDPGILNNLAWAYHQLGDRRARVLAAEAHKRAPNAPAILDTYGWILTSTGAARDGLPLLQRAARAAPRDPNIRVHLAQAYRATGQRAEAARELRLALAQPGLENPAGARQLLAQMGS